MNNKPVSIILVDDEPEACENLENIINQFITNEINILGYAFNTIEAGEKIKALNPDAIFLDIEMLNENAFQFLEKLGEIPFEIVFVTAYDEYAIRAFKLNAVDYILKPINIHDLKVAIERLQERIRYKNILKQNNRFYSALSEQINKQKQQDQIIIKDSNQLEAVAFRNIIYVKAMGSYSKIFYRQQAEEKNVLMSRPIAEYEELFPPDIFFRSHRSFLINCQYIRYFSREDMTVTMSNGEVLPVGRRRFTDLLAFIKSHPV